MSIRFTVKRLERPHVGKANKLLLNRILLKKNKEFGSVNALGLNN